MSLPATSAELLDWGWDDYAPHYEALASAELDARMTLPAAQS